MWELVIVRNHNIPERTDIWKPPLLFSARVTLHLNIISYTELLFAIFHTTCLHFDVIYLKQITYGKLKKKYICKQFRLLEQPLLDQFLFLFLRAQELRSYALALNVACKMDNRKPRVLFVQFHPLI